LNKTHKNGGLLCPPFLQRKIMKDFDIEKVSALSKLEIRDSEKETLRREMNSMVTFANKVKTSAQYTPASKNYTKAVLRSDTVSQSLDREALLAQAPQTKNGYISVARAVKESEDGV